jgi:SNF2 family DNA or RNA helicase
MITCDRFGEDQIVITSDYPARDKDLIMSLPGARFKYNEMRFLAPLTWASCRALRGIFGENLVVGGVLNDWAGNEKATRITPALQLRAAYDSEGDSDLYPFQRAGVLFLSYARRALLADDMGTGKTVQTIRTLAKILDRGSNPFPAVVVAPNNMVITWQKEFNQWWPGIKVVVVKGSIKKRKELLAEPAHVYVINYEGLKGHTRLAPYGSVRLKHCIECDPTLPNDSKNQLRSCERCKKEFNKRVWKTVVVDEAHKMKDPKAKQTRAVWALRTDGTENVFALTGTPVADAPHDLWPAFHLISEDEFPSRAKYVERYCKVSINNFGPMSIVGLYEPNKEEFFDIIDPRMRRMPKEAVLPFLPRKTYTERYVEMNPKQAKAYAQMESGLIAQIGQGVVVAANPLVQLTRMTQFASAYAELDENGEVRLSAPSCKVDAMLEIIEELNGDPLVVMAQSKQLIDLAAHAAKAHGIEHRLIVGGQNADEREAAKMDFQQGRAQIILCTIAAGGIGITLTKAHTLAFLQRSWSMIDNSQAEDRVHRIGAEVHDKITIVDIIAQGTLEERQRIVLGGKMDRMQEVVRDRETLLRVLGAKAL